MPLIRHLYASRQFNVRTCARYLGPHRHWGGSLACEFAAAKRAWFDFSKFWFKPIGLRFRVCVYQGCRTDTGNIKGLPSRGGPSSVHRQNEGGKGFGQGNQALSSGEELRQFIEINCTVKSDSHILFFQHLLPVILDQKGSLLLEGKPPRGDLERRLQEWIEANQGCSALVAGVRAWPCLQG